MNPRQYRGPLVILTSLFFMWGFITCLSDILIPHLKSLFSLSYTEAMLIQFCFFMAYFLISLPSGMITQKIGYQKSIVVGLATVGIGCLIFYPAATYTSYIFFLIGFFVLASGITLLQVAANPYVTILGPEETASSRLTLTQAFNSLGTTIAPYLGAIFILSVAVKSQTELSALTPSELVDYKLLQASTVKWPYLILAFVLFLMALIFAVIKLPKVQEEKIEKKQSEKSAWAYPHLVLGAIAIFVYVGAEVSIGSFLVNYLGDSSIASLPENLAGKYVAFYWGGAMVGRFIGSFVQRYIKAGKVLAFNGLMAAALVVISMLTNGTTAMWSILLVGLFNSIMFPTIFSLAISRLAKATGQGSGILCMAIVGGAIIPMIQGMFADKIGIHHAFILPVICYIYISYYGLKGHKVHHD